MFRSSKELKANKLGKEKMTEDTYEGFAEVEFFGDWNSTPYDKDSSRRLIAVAKK